MNVLNKLRCGVSKIIPPQNTEQFQTIWKVASTNNLLPRQGVQEAIRISCAGYPTKRTFDEFLDRFGVLAPDALDGYEFQ